MSRKYEIYYFISSLKFIEFIRLKLIKDLFIMDNQEQNYPNQWICPISQQLMTDPVIADDGFSYEKVSIQKWFKTSNISPITGLQLSTTKLIANRALKNTIQQFLSNSFLKEQKNKNQIHQLGIKESKKKVPKPVIQKFIEERIELKAFSIFNPEDQSYILNLQLITPESMGQKKRKPISLVCILDTSESMNIDAVKDSKQNESHGFSRLDLVRHSMNTLIEFMNQDDQLTLITFNTGAKCLMQTTKMNNAGKKLALQKIKDIEGQGTTNIWEGLRISFELLKKINHKGKNVFTILLTDGEPNLNPPRGIIPTLKKYIQIEKLDTPNFHVFGYGYELDTKVLQQIARIGAGTFAYIPDCSMVGTVFLNFMANCLTTITNKAILEIIFPQGSKSKEIFGLNQLKRNQYNLGCIQYGQKRDLLIPIQKDGIKEGSINFRLRYGQTFQQQQKLQIQSNLEAISVKDRNNIRIRFKYLQLLTNCIRYGNNFELALNDIRIFYYSLLKQEKNQFISMLLKELKSDNDQNLGQVQKAFLKQQWYSKWGKNYIPSLLLAHLLQVCTNFKDPLLQSYGGQIFFNYQNQMDSIFIKMEPPKPSAKKQKNIVYKPAPVDMSSYYRHYGGCIDGESQVKVWRVNQMGTYNYQTEKLKNIKKGDIIGRNKIKVECMVQTRVFSYIEMVKIGSLTITPWHPIFYDNDWKFPIDINPSQNVFIQIYYNFVTERNEPLEVEDIDCISLGHKIQNHPITAHEYLSSRKVINDLQLAHDNYQKGHVVICDVQRNPNTNQISKFIVV